MIAWRYIMKKVNFIYPLSERLRSPKLSILARLTTRGIVFVCLFFGSQFRLVNYFDSEIVRSLSAYFGKTRSEIGYSYRFSAV